MTEQEAVAILEAKGWRCESWQGMLWTWWRVTPPNAAAWERMSPEALIALASRERYRIGDVDGGDFYV